MKLNIGCGREYLTGFDNIDISREVKAEHYLDIRKDKLPYADGGVEHIYISGVLEQIRENEDLVFALNECHRVLKRGGTIQIIVPNATHPNAFKDPFDCRRFTEPTFDYITRGTREYTLYGSVYGFKEWSMKNIKTNNNGIIVLTMEK